MKNFYIALSTVVFAFFFIFSVLSPRVASQAEATSPAIGEAFTSFTNNESYCNLFIEGQEFLMDSLQPEYSQELIFVLVEANEPAKIVLSKVLDACKINFGKMQEMDAHLTLLREHKLTKII